jgi:hypothetical protein
MFRVCGERSGPKTLGLRWWQYTWPKRYEPLVKAKKHEPLVKAMKHHPLMKDPLVKAMKHHPLMKDPLVKAMKHHPLMKDQLYQIWIFITIGYRRYWKRGYLRWGISMRFKTSNITRGGSWIKYMRYLLFQTICVGEILRAYCVTVWLE